MSEIISNSLDPVLSTSEVGRRAAIRAAAHLREESTLRIAQRWHDRAVTDMATARVLLALEYYNVRPYRNMAGRWFAPTGSSLTGLGPNLSTIINELIRTGLVRHWRDREGDHLIPAPVHYRATTTSPGGAVVTVHSACLFVGEDMGPMRARLVEQLDLTDCLACCQVVATGSVRGL
jgi:hypothetical protein